MARIADLFTNGGYSKALEERDSLADLYTGNTGYSNAQNQALRYANELARGRASQIAGGTFGMSAGQRIALATQAQQNLPASFYDFTQSMGENAVNAANMRVAQQQADAMNAQERIGQVAEGLTQALANGAKAGILAYDGKQEAAPSTTFKTAPADPNSALSPLQASYINTNPDELFDQENTWKGVYDAHRKAGMSDSQIADKFDNTKWGKQGEKYKEWRGLRTKPTSDLQFGNYHG